MKINFIIFILAISALCLISCKDSTSGPPPSSQAEDYFPNKNGTSYNFIIQVSDSAGILFSGSRTINYKNETILDSTTYQVEEDSFELDRSNYLFRSFFRKSETGVFYFADTSGFTFNIPDSLKQYLKIDNEQRLLFTPLSINQNWPVYKLNFISFTVFNVYASVISVDTLMLDLNNIIQNKESLKLKYKLDIQLSPEGPILVYEANGWIVKDIGFVKWDGDAEVVNFLLNENVFPPETNVKMDLSTYQF